MNEDNLRTEIDALRQANKALAQLLNYTIEQIMEIQQDCADLKISNAACSLRIENLPYEIFAPRYRHKYDIPKIMTVEETIDEIVLNKKSIARFGDGEFSVMFGRSRWRFQKDDSKLAARLKEVITSEEENILIGLNDFYGDLSHEKKSDVDWIRAYITPEVRAEHMKLLDLNRVYAHACISRNVTMERVKNQKRIWDNKECIFIEGDKTRMGVGNDLFDNVKSIQRILCPAESAFDNYSTILNEALKLPLDKTILIALGPTASVLAYDLAKAGYHAIDIGHADLTYEWLLRTGCSEKAAVSHKYNNEYEFEVGGGYIVEDIHDEKYESEIIADLSEKSIFY